MDKTGKGKRQELLAEIIRSKRIGGQKKLLRELLRFGIRATQASVSRDLMELGIVKIKGFYHLPSFGTEKVPIGEIMEVDTAGDNLIVIKTPPGQASMTALAVDRMKIPGIVGTVAGDDTFFVAVKSQAEQKMIMRQILRLSQ
jgi:transcriptional regulator of arginine metabolism